MEQDMLWKVVKLTWIVVASNKQSPSLLSRTHFKTF